MGLVGLAEKSGKENTCTYGLLVADAVAVTGRLLLRCHYCCN